MIRLPPNTEVPKSPVFLDAYRGSKEVSEGGRDAVRNENMRRETDALLPHGSGSFETREIVPLSSLHLPRSADRSAPGSLGPSGPSGSSSRN